MSDSLVRTDERTKYEACLDIKYGFRFNDMNARLYRHLDGFFGFVGLFGGTAAATSALADFKSGAVAAGLALAACAVVERLVRPVEKAVAHDDAKRRYADLSGRVELLDMATTERELSKLQAEGPDGFATLARPAFNANLKSNGRPDAVVSLSFFERMMAAIA